jgi:hypothetical protein
MIGRFEARDLRGDFFASPLAQGGEDQGEGFERTRFESILPSPSPLNKERRPRTCGVAQIS